MKFQDLIYFKALAESKSYTQVAQDFEISQPTVTYAVKRLEEELTVDLTDKSLGKRHVLLTQAGEALAKRACEIQDLLEITKLEVQQLDQEKIKLGMPPIISAYLMVDMVKNLENLNLLPKIQTLRAGSSDLLTMMYNGELDVSLIGSLTPFSDDRLKTCLLKQSPFGILLSKAHPLANKKELSFSELLDEKFILLDEHNVHLKAFNALNKRHHYQAKAYFKIDDMFVIESMIRQNLGISLLTEAATKLGENLIMIPLKKEEQLFFYISYVYRKNAFLSENTKKLISYFNELTITD
ncbi:LysR family transcriptional regulator [Streptococcus dentiloxodontae]